MTRPEKPAAEWSYPVQCTHCHRAYDAGAVTVTARYTDCSVWTSPCCGFVVDDRPTGLKFRSDIRVITHAEAQRIQSGDLWTHLYGTPRWGR